MNRNMMDLFNNYLSCIYNFFYKNEEIDIELINNIIKTTEPLISNYQELNQRLIKLSNDRKIKLQNFKNIKQSLISTEKKIKEQENILNNIHDEINNKKNKLKIYRDLIQKTISQNCVICMDQCTEKIGYLQCNHEFCFECINNWSNNKKTCPICNKKFSNIKTKKIKKNNNTQLKKLLNTLDEIINY